MNPQAEKVRQLIARSHAILVASLVAELHRAIAFCEIAKMKITNDAATGLHYLLVAEATSAKFMKLRSQGKIVESSAILRLMSLLEEGLGGPTVANLIPAQTLSPSLHVTNDTRRERSGGRAGFYPSTFKPKTRPPVAA
jgi:hypothetical protein